MGGRTEASDGPWKRNVIDPSETSGAAARSLCIAFLGNYRTISHRAIHENAFSVPVSRDRA